MPGIQSTILHPREMVLPAFAAQGLRNMIESGATAGGHSFHFSPVIQAVDAEGVDRILTKHQRLFEMRVDKVLRKRGFGGK